MIRRVERQRNTRSGTHGWVWPSDCGQLAVVSRGAQRFHTRGSLLRTLAKRAHQQQVSRPDLKTNKASLTSASTDTHARTHARRCTQGRTLPPGCCGVCRWSPLTCDPPPCSGLGCCSAASRESARPRTRSSGRLRLSAAFRSRIDCLQHATNRLSNTRAEHARASGTTQTKTPEHNWLRHKQDPQPICWFAYTLACGFLSGDSTSVSGRARAASIPATTSRDTFTCTRQAE